MSEDKNTGVVQTAEMAANTRSADFFLRILGPSATAFHFRTFADHKGTASGLARKFSGPLDAVAPKLEELNSQGAGVFVVVNEGGQTKDEITRIRAVFADTDGAPLEPLIASLPPHLVVKSSPGKWHVYWLTTDDFPLEHFASVQLAIAGKFGTDPAVKDLPRVMRLPGYNHCKGEPVPVGLLTANADLPRYTFNEVVHGLGLELPRTGQPKDSAACANLEAAAGIGGFAMPTDGSIGEGRRNAFLASAAGWLMREGVKGKALEAMLEAVNAAKCSPPLPVPEVRQIARSVARYENLSDWPDPKPIAQPLPPVAVFNPDWLPDAFKRYVIDLAELMQVPPEMIAAPLLVAAAATVGNVLAIAPKKRDASWLVGAVLWGAIVGRPGVMKSPAINAATKPLGRLEMAMAAAFDVKRQQYQADKIAYDVQMTAAKAAAKNGGPITLPPVPVEPQPERLVCNDSTSQKLAEILSHSPRGVLVIRDEITALLESLSAEGQEGARGFYLEAWNGYQPYRVDRVGRGSIIIPRLAVFILGGIQPGRLQHYVRQATAGGGGDDGLLQRFQILVWPDVPTTWKNIDRPADAAALQAVEAAFGWLRNIDPVAIGATIDPNGDRPAYLNFTDEAQDRYDRWRAALEHSLRNGNKPACLESHLSKYKSLIPAIALVTHLADGGTGPVTLNALRKAMYWGDYLWTHAKRVYASATDSGAFAAAALADRIKSGKLANGFSAREVLRHKWQYLTTPEDVREALDWLTEAHWVRAEEKPSGEAGGRPTKTYTLNPKVLSVSAPTLTPVLEGKSAEKP